MKPFTWILLLLLVIAGGAAINATIGSHGSGWRSDVHDLYSLISGFALGFALGKFGIKG